MTDCRLCGEISIGSSAAFWNKPLFESSNFVVLPSLGALVEGWLLLVPKMHSISMGALTDSTLAELKYRKNVLASEIYRRYGSACAFEHGPSKKNCLVGCGVDHAHLHLVPVDFDLASAVKPLLPADVSWSPASLEECQVSFRKGNDYLYLEQPIGIGRIALHSAFGSQLFRRAIASQQGMAHQFSWREYPRLAEVSATVREVRGWAPDLCGSMR